jgi:hypothetical protein
MNTTKILTLLGLGVLCLIVIIVLVGSQTSPAAPEQTDGTPEHTAEVATEYQGPVVLITGQRDLIHVLDTERGLIAVGVPPEVRTQIVTLDDSDLIVLKGVSVPDRPADYVRLQEVVSIEPRAELSPEDSARLNGEFRDLRL